MNEKTSARRASERLRPETRGRLWRRIYLPVLGAVFIMAGLVAAFVCLRVGTLRVWADVSLVFLILPVLFLGVLVLGMLVALTYATVRLTAWLLGPLRKVQGPLEQVTCVAKRASDLVARPFIVLPAVGLALGRSIGWVLRIRRG